VARSSDIAAVQEQGGINGVANPSFEVDTASWGGTGSGSTLVRVTSEHHFGTACGRMSTTGDNQWVDTPPRRYIPGKIHIFSVYVKGTAGHTIHLNVYTGTVDDAGNAVTLTGDWQRISRTVTLALSGTPQMQIRRYSGDTADAVYIDGAMVQVGSTLSTYLDGSLGVGYGWYGTVHNSVSYRKSRALA
jgi:hypothetical protein